MTTTGEPETGASTSPWPGLSPAAQRMIDAEAEQDRAARAKIATADEPEAGVPVVFAASTVPGEGMDR